MEQGTKLGTASVTGSTDQFFELVKELFLEVSRFLNAMLTEDEELIIAKILKQNLWMHLLITIKESWLY